MAIYHCADANDFKYLFGDLFEGIDAKISDIPVGIDDKAYVGSYVDDEGAVVAVCISDLPISAYTSAAITMFPKSQADDSITDGSLEESLKENLFEVMNIGSRLFLTDLTPHLKHRDVEQATALPDDVMTFIQDKNDISVKQLHIELPKYGEGYLTLINR